MKTSSEAFIYIIGLRFYFLPVFEGEADVVGRVDGAVVHQPVPALQREFGQLIRHGCKGFQEILNAGPLGLHLMDFICDRVQSGLGLLESFGQAVVAFLVFGLVEGNVCVFVDALLNHVGDHLRLLLEFFLLPLQVGGVKEQGHHFPAIRDDCILGGQQLVRRRQERLLDDVIGQVRSATMLVAVEFVIALPDDLLGLRFN